MKLNLFCLTLASVSSSVAIAQSAFVNKGAGTFKPVDLVCEMSKTIATVEEGSDTQAYISWNKPTLSGGVLLTTPSAAGPGCGAGHCYYEFFTGAYKYQVARTNIVDDVNSLWAGRVTVQKSGATIYNQSCRTPARTMVQCITKNRAIYVSKSASGVFGYKAYDHAGSFTVPTLALSGGTASYGEGSGLATYRFVNGAYAYQVLTAPADPSSNSGYARLIVTKGSTVLADQLCEAYSLGYGAL